MEKKSKERLVDALKSKGMIAVYIVVGVLLAVIIVGVIFVNSLLDKLGESDVDIVHRDEEYIPDLNFPSDYVPSEPVVDENELMGDGDNFFDTPSYTPENAPKPVGTYEDFVVYDKYYEPDASNTPIYYKEQKDPNILNFILLARDTRDAYRDRGRTDSMMVVSYNKKTRETKLISLQRDMLVPIEGRQYWNKLNTAFFYGGVGLSINTVNDLFGMDIQRYVTVVVSSVAPLVDKIGGIELYVTSAEANYFRTSEHADIMGDIVPGWNHMNGDQVTVFVRNRSVGNADASRTRRQRDAIEAIYTKILTEYSLSEVVELINYAAPIIATNFTNDEIISLASDILLGGEITIDDHRIPEEGDYESVWYGDMLALSTDFEEAKKDINNYIYGE
jgi:LCP family protein required for cell wall assembly